MPLRLNDITFYTATEVAAAAGIARSTLWRWRKAGRVPQGRRYRGRERLFTLAEAEAVHRYARRSGPPPAHEASSLSMVDHPN